MLRASGLIIAFFRRYVGCRHGCGGSGAVTGFARLRDVLWDCECARQSGRDVAQAIASSMNAIALRCVARCIVLYMSRAVQGAVSPVWGAMGVQELVDCVERFLRESLGIHYRCCTLSHRGAPGPVRGGGAVELGSGGAIDLSGGGGVNSLALLVDCDRMVGALHDFVNIRLSTTKPTLEDKSAMLGSVVSAMVGMARCNVSRLAMSCPRHNRCCPPPCASSAP